MGGAGDHIGGGVDGERANRSPPTIHARFGDEDCGEAGVGGGDVSGRIAQEPAGWRGVTRPQEDRARGGRGGGRERDGAGGAGNGDPIASGERFKDGK